MRKVVMFAALAVLFLGGATSAMADHKGCDKKADCKNRYSKMFEKKDSNSDGVITKEEFMAYAESKFAKMDTNGNGWITSEEAESYSAAKKEKYKKESGQCAGKENGE